MFTNTKWKIGKDEHVKKARSDINNTSNTFPFSSTMIALSIYPHKFQSVQQITTTAILCYTSVTPSSSSSKNQCQKPLKSLPFQISGPSSTIIKLTGNNTPINMEGTKAVSKAESKAVSKAPSYIKIRYVYIAYLPTVKLTVKLTIHE